MSAEESLELEPHFPQQGLLIIISTLIIAFSIRVVILLHILVFLHFPGSTVSMNTIVRVSLDFASHNQNAVTHT